MAKITSSRVEADIELTEIVIRLHRFEVPEIELRGRLASATDRRLERASVVTLTTGVLPPSGERFIADMKEAVRMRVKQ